MKEEDGIISVTVISVPSETGPHEVKINLTSTKGFVTEVFINFYFVIDKKVDS